MLCPPRPGPGARETGEREGETMKTVTIFIDGSANDTESLKTAVAFCRRIDGRLRVVHPMPQDTVIATPDAHAVVLVRDEDDVAARSSAARAAYGEVCGALEFAHWKETEETETEAIVSQGLYSDAVILERAFVDEGPKVLALNTALFETPGAVLVTPPKAPAAIGRNVAVVWSPTVQSARAVRTSLPILQTADSVTVLTNSERADADPTELADYLSVHGVKAELRSFEGAGLTARGRGRAILAATAECGADLLVMGAYGENRLTALIGLGRATRKVVSATKIPTLLQH